MLRLITSIILIAILIYIICGVCFNFFIARGLQKLDEDVPGSSWDLE